ncbi:hypothetical protein [Roseovarius nitratireducens]|uniref:hypothetical protein n=1 Tax=Roseovarius nitratireducens TaxID=2044597 RepID=UPI000CE24C3E|nr:hypothetical protein [Roseovarius nitratireducens]
MKASVKRDGEYAVIRIPMADIHRLRVSLEQCPCRAPKSNEATEIRESLSGALGRLESLAQRRGFTG